jgi:hypothetical protein
VSGFTQQSISVGYKPSAFNMQVAASCMLRASACLCTCRSSGRLCQPSAKRITGWPSCMLPHALLLTASHLLLLCLCRHVRGGHELPINSRIHACKRSDCRMPAAAAAAASCSYVHGMQELLVNSPCGPAHALLRLYELAHTCCRCC